MKEVTSIINVELTFVTLVDDNALMPAKDKIEEIFKDAFAGKADKVEVKNVKHFEMILEDDRIDARD